MHHSVEIKLKVGINKLSNLGEVLAIVLLLRYFLENAEGALLAVFPLLTDQISSKYLTMWEDIQKGRANNLFSYHLHLPVLTSGFQLQCSGQQAG